MSKIGLWVDDVRTPPNDFYYQEELVHWFWVKRVSWAKSSIREHELVVYPYDLISLDHDAGEFVLDGGDYIRLLDWLEETGRNYPIRIHSQNPVGIENMRRIIQRNGWEEVK